MDGKSLRPVLEDPTALARGPDESVMVMNTFGWTGNDQREDQCSYGASGRLA